MVMPNRNNQPPDFPAVPMKKANLPKGRDAKFPI